MENYYDATAANYNELHGEEQLKKFDVIKQNVADPGKVLDVGCGTGLSDVLGWDVIGIDPARELLKQASFPVVEGTADALPFADKSFDCVICVTAFHHFPNALLEMKRVSRKYVIVSLLKKANEFEKHVELIRKNLTVQKEIDVGVDLVFVAVR